MTETQYKERYGDETVFNYKGRVQDPPQHSSNCSARLAFFVVANYRRLARAVFLRSSRSGLCRAGLRHVLLHRADQRRKSVRVMHRHVRQNLAVQIDSSGFQRMYQLAVRRAVVARGRSDTLNPQGAVITLSHAAVAVGVTQRAIDGFFCGAVELSLGQEKPFGVFQELFTAGPAFGSTFNSRHGSFSWCKFQIEFDFVQGDKRGPVACEAPRKAEHTSSRTGLSRSTNFALHHSLKIRRAKQPAGRHPLRSASAEETSYRPYGNARRTFFTSAGLT